MLNDRQLCQVASSRSDAQRQTTLPSSQFTIRCSQLTTLPSSQFTSRGSQLTTSSRTLVQELMLNDRQLCQVASSRADAQRQTTLPSSQFTSRGSQLTTLPSSLMPGTQDHTTDDSTSRRCRNIGSSYRLSRTSVL
jgi:hypothetical protein